MPSKCIKCGASLKKAKTEYKEYPYGDIVREEYWLTCPKCEYVTKVHLGTGKVIPMLYVIAGFIIFCLLIVLLGIYLMLQ